MSIFALDTGTSAWKPPSIRLSRTTTIDFHGWTLRAECTEVSKRYRQAARPAYRAIGLMICDFTRFPRPSAMLHRPLLCVSNHAIFAGLGATPHCPPKSEFLQEFQWLDAAIARRPARG